MSGADLIMLPQQAGAPAPASATFWVVNSRTVARTLRHADNALTMFADLEFRPGSLASPAGTPLGPDDSVSVIITPDAGRYGLSLSPSTLSFSATARPTVTFSYARYGDLAAGLASSRYTSAQAYAAALDIWREVGLDLWSPAPASASTGTDGVRARMHGGGRYGAAAPR